MFQDVLRCFSETLTNKTVQLTRKFQFCPVSIWSTVVDVEDVLDVEVDDVLDEVVEEEDTVDEVLQGTLKQTKTNKQL